VKPSRRSRSPYPAWLGLLLLALGASLLAINLWTALELRALLRDVRGGAWRREGVARAVRPGPQGPRSEPQATLLQGRLRLEGETSSSCAVVVVSEGEVLETKVARGGPFVLENLPVRRGRNRLIILAVTARAGVDTLGIVELHYRPPGYRELVRSLDRGPTDRRCVALTLDGGSLNNVGEEILDFLKQEGVRATFFLTGEFIRRYPSTVRRIVQEGHQAGNHTWSHPHLTTWELDRRHLTRPGVTKQFLQEELEKTARLFRQVTGQEMSPYWRAPYGEHNEEIRAWAAELGYRHVGWTVGRDSEHNLDTMDWVADAGSPAYQTAEEIAGRILRMAREEPDGISGAVILMHMGSERNSDFPHRKLPDILRGLKELGYQFVTVEEMFP